jgi:hypothetical protein
MKIHIVGWDRLRAIFLCLELMNCGYEAELGESTIWYRRA